MPNTTLPWYKFTPDSWLSGKIQFASLEAQGLYVNITALYWRSAGSIAAALLERRFPNASSLLAELADLCVLSIDASGMISIPWLDAEYQDCCTARDKRSNAGRLGGKASAARRASRTDTGSNDAKQCLSNAAAKPEQCSSNIRYKIQDRREAVAADPDNTRARVADSVPSPPPPQPQSGSIDDLRIAVPSVYVGTDERKAWEALIVHYGYADTVEACRRIAADNRRVYVSHANEWLSANWQPG